MKPLPLLLGAALCAALAPANALAQTALVNLSVQAGFASADTETLQLTFNGETTQNWSLTGTTVEGTPWRTQVKLGKEYTLVESGLDAADTYELNFDVPAGYLVFVSAPDATDLINRRQVQGLNQTSTSDTIRIRVERRTEFAEPAGFARADSLAVDRPLWQVGMGRLENGLSAGAIRISANQVSSLGFNPSDLIYDSPSAEVAKVLDANGRLRQVNAPQGLADVVYSSGTTYDVRFYSWKDVEAWNGSTYNIRTGAVPVITYTIANYGSTGIDIRKTVGAKYWTTRLNKSGSTWTLHDWTENTANPSDSNSLRRAVTVVSTAGATETRDTTISGMVSSVWTSSAVYQLIFTTYAWGEELTGQTLGSGSPTLVTSYTYYSNPSDGNGQYGKLKRVTRPDSGYTEYEYYNDADKRGQVHKVHSPFGDTNAGQRTEYTYVTDGTGDRFLPDVVKTFVNSTEVARVDHDYANFTRNGQPVRETTTKTYTDASSYLTEVSAAYREDASDPFLRGVPYSVKRPNGTQTSWSYADLLIYDFYEGFWVWRTYKVKHAIHGTTASPSGHYTSTTMTTDNGNDIEDLYVSAGQSTIDRVQVDVSGLTTSSYTGVCDTGTAFRLVRGEAREHDLAANLTKATRLTYVTTGGGYSLDSSQVMYEATYTNGQLTSEKNEVGAVKTFTYDTLGRVSVEVELGKSANSSPYATPAIPDRRIEYAYNGSNQILGRHLAENAGSEKILNTFEYDLLGRLTKSIVDDAVTTRYEYPAADQKKTINGDSGYVLENHFLDGTLDSRTGDAAPPLYQKRAATAGGIRSQSALGSFASVGTQAEGWQITQSDWMGRLSHTETERYDGGSRFTVHSYHGTTGQLLARYVRGALGSDDLLSPYRFTYEPFGRVVLEGLDLDNNGSISEGSTVDRITKVTSENWKDGSGHWWSVQKHYDFPSTSAVLSRETRRRIAPAAGELERSLVRDVNGNETATWSEVDRTNAIVATKTDFSPRPTGDGLTVTKLGLAVRRQEPSGVKVDYTYDALWRMISEKGRDSVLTRYTYKPASAKVASVSHDYGGASPLTIIQYEYTHGRLTKETRPNYAGGALPDEITNLTYTLMGKVDRRSGNGVTPVNYDYDSYGRLTEQRVYQNDAETLTSKVTWTYQARTGLVTEEKHFNGATGKSKTLQYNKLGRVSRRTWARGAYTDYTYSADDATSSGDLELENHSDTTTDVAYTYDRMGRVKTVTDTTGLRTFHYNANSGLSLSEEDLNDSFYGSGTSRNIAFAYEGSGGDLVPGRFQSAGYGGVSWSQTYEPGSGRVDQVKAIGSGFSNTFDYAYDTDSNRVASMDGGSFDQERSFESWRENPVGTAAKWSGVDRARYSSAGFTWQGQMTACTLEHDGASSLAAKLGAGGDFGYSMTYNPRHQTLTWDTALFAGTESSYAWDAAGNPSSYDGQAYEINGLNQIEPAGGGSTEHVYDDDGNLTTDPSWTYTWNADNRLASMNSSTLSIQYKYDFQGRRVEKEVRVPPLFTLQKHLKYLYVGTELVAELDSAGALRKSFHWGLDTSDTRGGAGGGGGLLMLRDHVAGTSYYPAHDLRGNLTGLMDSAGEFAAWYEYDAFGKVVTDGGAYKDENPIRFASQYTDEETGLVAFLYRYYDPAKGRFLNRDPIGFAGGDNLYGFAGNDPVNRADYLGLESIHMDGGGFDFMDWAVRASTVNSGVDGGVPIDKYTLIDIAASLDAQSELEERIRSGSFQLLDGQGVPEGVVANVEALAPLRESAFQVEMVTDDGTVIMVPFHVYASQARGNGSWHHRLAFMAGDSRLNPLLRLAAYGAFAPVNLRERFRAAAYEASFGDAMYAEAQADIMLGMTAEVAIAGVTAVVRSLRAVSTSATLVRVGGLPATVDDVLRNPSILTGQGPTEIQAVIGSTPGWRIEALGRGSHAGQGWVLREYSAAGNPTGRMLRWHPGGGHHGPNPYWRVTGGPGGKSGVIPGGPR